MPNSLYIITNCINAKIYIGVTSNALKMRWSQHKSEAVKGTERKLYIAMRKHGIENFALSLLATFDTWEETLSAEQNMIELFCSYRRGYNSTSGDEGSPGASRSKETRDKLSLKRLGHSVSAESRQKIGAAQKGKLVTKETREKLRLSHLGQVPLNRGKSRGVTYIFNGENHTITEWSQLTGINRRTLACRLRAGWALNKALSKKKE